MKFRKLSWVLCEDLDAWWGGGGREDQEEGDVNMQLADFTSLQQKWAQHGRAMTRKERKKEMAGNPRGWGKGGRAWRERGLQREQAQIF